MKGKGVKNRVLVILALVAVATSLFSSRTLAKYASRFSAGGTFTVAGFAGGGTVNFDVPLTDMTPGSVKPVRFTVCNFEGEKNSDVALTYSIRVETTGNLPLSFSLIGQKESDDSSAQSVTAAGLARDGEANVWTASGGSLPSASAEGKKTHSYELSVSWPAGDYSGDYSHEIDMVTVSVTTVQAKPASE